MDHGVFKKLRKNKDFAISVLISERERSLQLARLELMSGSHTHQKCSKTLEGEELSYNIKENNTFIAICNKIFFKNSSKL